MLITFLFTSSHCLMPGRTFRWLSLKKRMCMEKAKTTTVDIVAPGQSLPYLSFRDIQRPWAIFWNVYPRVGFSSPHDLSHISWHRAPNWPIYTTTGKTNKARISWHIRRDISMKKKMKINIIFQILGLTISTLTFTTFGDLSWSSQFKKHKTLKNFFLRA